MINLENVNWIFKFGAKGTFLPFDIDFDCLKFDVHKSCVHVWWDRTVKNLIKLLLPTTRGSAAQTVRLLDKYHSLYI
jgi:hypothetical protein